MQFFFGILLWFLPKNLLSRMVGWLVRLHLPFPFRQLALRWFASRYRLNLSEAERPLDQYQTIQDLFTRRLKSGSRPIANALVVSPADSLLTEQGRIKEGSLIQAKGLSYHLADLLADSDGAKDMEGGSYFTFYLCPTDYHRVHAPIEGQITNVTYCPGTLWPVNEWSVKNVPRLFARNERVIIWIRSAYGMVAVVMVGATNVGQMTLSFDPEVITNQVRHRPTYGRRWDGSGQRPDVLRRNYDPPIAITRGEEIGIFNMGSTVVVVFPSAFTGWLNLKGQNIEMGQPLSSFRFQ